MRRTSCSKGSRTVSLQDVSLSEVDGEQSLAFRKKRIGR